MFGWGAELILFSFFLSLCLSYLLAFLLSLLLSWLIGELGWVVLIEGIVDSDYGCGRRSQWLDDLR